MVAVPGSLQHGVWPHFHRPSRAEPATPTQPPFVSDDGDSTEVGCRRRDGLTPNDQLKLLGNGVVPHQALAAITALVGRIAIVTSESAADALLSARV